MVNYIWQNKTWPKLDWKLEKVMSAFAEAKKAQGYILGQSDYFDLKELAEIITEEAFSTSKIEGENLDKNNIRSSVAKRLGLPTAGLPEAARNTDGLVEILMDATNNHEKKLNGERLFSWHAALFPTGYSGMFKIKVAGWRETITPMQVISGTPGKEKVHFEAPASVNLESEMLKFFEWWNHPPENLDGLIRAAIAHIWFITIHPFEDGNGRIARCLTDMALAQEEKTSKRLYSLSSQIIENKNSYYDILEKTQKGDGDISEWIIWFLETFTKSIQHSRKVIEKTMFVKDFYSNFSQIVFNERQKKVIGKLLADCEGNLTRKKYVAITKTSDESAKRDIKDLVEKGVLIQNEGGGRSTSYRLLNKF